MRFRLALTLATGAALLASCGHERRDLRITLRDACGLTESADCERGEGANGACGSAHCSREAAWANLAVFEGGCPPADALLTGNLNDAIRVVTGKAGSALPSIGELEEARHGFAGIFRASDCTIVGAGCTEVDLSDERNVQIDLHPVTGNGACGDGHACEQGLCAPSADPAGEDPSSKAGACLPLLVASGALPERSADSVASGLGMVATEAGYLVGYREEVEGSGPLLVRIVPIGKDGEIGASDETRIEHCAGSFGDGLGMALSDESGLLATSLAPCDGHGAGAAFVSFTPDGTIVDARRVAGAGSDLVLAPSRSLAPGRAANDFELVYLTGGAAHRLGLTGTEPHATFQALFPDARASFAQVASSQDVIARLVGSKNAIHLGIGPWESTPRTVRLEGSAVASLAVHRDRVVVVRNLEEGGLVWEGRTRIGASFGDGRFETNRALTALDVVTANGEAIVIAATSSGFFLLPIGDMSGSLAPLPKLIVQHAPASSAHDAQSLAVASIDDRLAIAWLNDRETSGSIGGYALFECSR